MSFILAKIQWLGVSQILSHFYLQRTGFWFDGVYQPGNLTDIPDFKFQHILTIFFNFFYFYFEVSSRSLTCQSLKFLLELMHLLFCLRILMEVTLMKLNLTTIISKKIYTYMSTHIAMWLERFKILHIMGFGSFELERMGRMGWVIPLRLSRLLEHLQC